MVCQCGVRRNYRQYRRVLLLFETLAGGYGGRAASDGPDAVQTHGQNTENAPIEETEINYPVRIARYELVENSEGPGKFRGGLGPPGVTTSSPTMKPPSPSSPTGTGRAPEAYSAAKPGRTASYFLNSNGKTVRLGSKTTVQLQPGDIVSYRTCGGGGYGLPAERDPERVLRDVRNGMVSRERAREIYLTEIDTEAWRVNNGENNEVAE